MNVPGLAPGAYYVQVLYSHDPWPWGDSGDYRILARSGEQLSPVLLVEVQEAGIPMVGQSHYYRLDLTSEADLILTASNANDSGERFQLYLQSDRLPSWSEYLAGSNVDRTQQVLDVPGLPAGTYYVRVFYAHDPWPWGDSGDYRLLVRSREQLPPLFLGDMQEAGVAMIGQSHYYRVDLASESDLVLTVSNANDGGERFEVYFQTGRLPTPGDHLAGSYNDSTEQILDLHGLAAGSHYVQVRYTHDPWPWGDSGDYRILCGAIGSTVAQVTPDRLGNAAPATLTIRGAGLSEGATVALIPEGQPPIQATETTFVSQARLLARFDLRGVEPGPCDVTVTSPFGPPAVLPGAVTIVAGGEAELWVDIVGRRGLRVGRPETYLVRVGNAGDVDTHDVLLWIELPPDVEVLGMDLPHPDDDSIDWASVPISFETDEARIVPIWLLRVPLGTSSGFKLTIVVHGGQAHEQGEIWAYLAQADSDFARSGSLEDIEDSPIFIALAEAIIEVLSGAGHGRSYAPTRSEDTLQEEVYQGLLDNTTEIIERSAPAGTVAVVTGYAAGGTMGSLQGGLVGLQSLAAQAVAEFYTQVLESLFDKIKALSKKLFERWLPGDPNEKVGPAGAGTGQFVRGDREFQYIVFFENLPTANAAAQEILIVDELDPSLDWATFSPGELQIGDRVVSVPEASQGFTTTIDLRPTMPALVDVACTYDPTTGQAEWLFTGVDPNTGGLADFLPPNTDEVDPRGRGWVSYTVSPQLGLSTGTVIRNTATIDFEVGIPPEPLETPEWVNTIDAEAPSSEVWSLEDTQAETDFLVSWSGEDEEDGSGLRDCTIYVSTDDGPYEVWLANTSETSATFAGEYDHDYAFYSRATDNVGHVEPAPADPDAVTVVVLEEPVPEPEEPGEPEPAPEPGPEEPEEPEITPGQESPADSQLGATSEPEGQADSETGATSELEGPANSEPGAPIAEEAPRGSGRGGTRGLCGIGACGPLIMGLCILGLGQLRHRRKD